MDTCILTYTIEISITRLGNILSRRNNFRFRVVRDVWSGISTTVKRLKSQHYDNLSSSEAKTGQVF